MERIDELRKQIAQLSKEKKYYKKQSEWFRMMYQLHFELEILEAHSKSKQF